MSPAQIRVKWVTRRVANLGRPLAADQPVGDHHLYVHRADHIGTGLLYDLRYPVEEVFGVSGCFHGLGSFCGVGIYFASVLLTRIPSLFATFFLL
jgi:hypothetical protein